LPEALIALSRAVELLPQNDDARAFLGELYLLRYQTDRDAPAYEKVKEICIQLLAHNAQCFATCASTGRGKSLLGFNP
jgi:hypothetical protein